MVERASYGDHQIIQLGKGDTFRIDRFVGLTSTVRIAVEHGQMHFYGIALVRKEPDNSGCSGRCRIRVDTNVQEGDPVKLLFPVDTADSDTKSRPKPTPSHEQFENEPVVVDLHLRAGDWVWYWGGLGVSLRSEGDEDAVVHRLLTTRAVT